MIYSSCSTEQPMQTFKIQIMSVNGWSDLKMSDADEQTEEYIVEAFNTREEAIKEMKEIIKALNDDPQNYRVVNYLVPEEFNLY
jgi:hypothetical protein